MSEPGVLAIETAAQLCSVSVLKANEVVASLSVSLPRAHAERLPLLIRDALEMANVGPADIAAVAVSAGPGSYTGLRIGVSAAKGFAFAIGAKLIAVHSLYARARAAAAFLPAGGIVACALPSRRDEVYAAVYRVRDNGRLDALVDGLAVAVSDFSALLPARGDSVLLVGEGASRLLPSIAHKASIIRTIPGPVPGFDASWVGHIGNERLQAGHVEDLHSFEPFYLKAFHATVPVPGFGGVRKSDT